MKGFSRANLFYMRRFAESWPAEDAIVQQAVGQSPWSHVVDLLDKHRQEPLRSLLSVADPIMRELAGDIGQSCNLGVLDGARVRIVAQVESPADFGFRVRVGSLFGLADTATGNVLAAFSGLVHEGFDEERLVAIREDRGLMLPDSMQPGITDVVVPVLRSTGTAVAALTVPYVSTSYSPSGADVARARAAKAARAIQATLGV